jgi:hypothetical protein
MLSYRPFVNTFQALEAPFFAHKRVLQVPGRHWIDGAPPPPKEFVAEENINYHKDTTVCEGDAHEDDETLLTSNLPPPFELSAHLSTMSSQLWKGGSQNLSFLAHFELDLWQLKSDLP